MQESWRNPYQAKKREKNIKQVKSIHSNPTIESSKANTPFSNQEVIQMMSNFKDGIKGISSSVQQFEKTVESLSELYNTFESLGGVKRLNQILSTKSAKGTNTQGGNPFSHLSTFVNLLEKVDFQQINQFLSSPMIQGMFPNEEKSNG